MKKKGMKQPIPQTDIVTRNAIFNKKKQTKPKNNNKYAFGEANYGKSRMKQDWKSKMWQKRFKSNART